MNFDDWKNLTCSYPESERRCAEDCRADAAADYQRRMGQINCLQQDVEKILAGKPAAHIVTVLTTILGETCAATHNSEEVPFEAAMEIVVDALRGIASAHKYNTDKGAGI